MYRKNFILIIPILSALLLVGGLHIHTANAQTQARELLITWQALNFYPSNYQGKAVLTPGSDMLISATLLENGVVANPDSTDFFWYVNGSLYTREVGQNELRLSLSDIRGGSISIRAVAETSGSRVEGTASARIFSPETVLVARSPSGVSGINGGHVSLTAIPYFFSVDSLEDLQFSWRIDNREVDIDRNAITIDTAQFPRAEKVGILAACRVSNRSSRFDNHTAARRIYTTPQGE